MNRRREQAPGQPRGGAKKWLAALLVLVLAGLLAYGALLGAVLLGDRDQIRGEAGVMIVLGCQVMPWGEPSILLQDRLEEALAYWEDHREITIVVSGGQGDNEPMSEARCMAEYLMAAGVPEEQILLEEESRNTDQNLRRTMELLAREGYDTTQNMVVVSNGFHLTRVRMLWSRVCGGEDALSTLAAPSSHLPSLLWMYIREPLALVKSFLFDR